MADFGTDVELEEFRAEVRTEARDEFQPHGAQHGGCCGWLAGRTPSGIIAGRIIRLRRLLRLAGRPHTQRHHRRPHHPTEAG